MGHGSLTLIVTSGFHLMGDQVLPFSHPFSHCLQVTSFQSYLFQRYVQQWTWVIVLFLNHFSHTCTRLFLVGFDLFLVSFLCGAFLFFVVMGITVDRCQGKQGENDKSQQDESYFKVCERQLHELLLLH